MHKQQDCGTSCGKQLGNALGIAVGYGIAVVTGFVDGPNMDLEAELRIKALSVPFIFSAAGKTLEAIMDAAFLRSTSKASQHAQAHLRKHYSGAVNPLQSHDHKDHRTNTQISTRKIRRTYVHRSKHRKKRN